MTKDQSREPVTLTPAEQTDLRHIAPLADHPDALEAVVSATAEALAVRLADAGSVSETLTETEREALSGIQPLAQHPATLRQVTRTIERILFDRLKPVFPEHPDDLGRVGRNYYACPSHCCARHGCKYGYTGCPVTTGQIAQENPCEWCTAALWESEAVPADGEVGFTVLLAARRTTQTDGGPMAAMPSDAHVAAKIAEALAGLDLGDGWAITRVVGEDA